MLFLVLLQTAVTGHVFGTDFQAKYNSWDKVDPVRKCMEVAGNDSANIPISCVIVELKFIAGRTV